MRKKLQVYGEANGSTVEIVNTMIQGSFYYILVWYVLSKWFFDPCCHKLQEHRYNRYMKFLSLLFFEILIEINSLVLVGQFLQH